MKRRREWNNMLVRRLIMAWQFKCWPWTLDWRTVKWVALDQSITPEDIARTRELADKYGWK